jgi:hypothetical protein
MEDGRQTHRYCYGWKRPLTVEAEGIDIGSQGNASPITERTGRYSLYIRRGRAHGHNSVITELCIIQYNCGNANGKSARPFFDSLDLGQYPIIAVQEPMVLTRQVNGTYCPRNYRLSRSLKGGERVVFIIHDKIPQTDWESVIATDYCEKLRIGRGRNEIQIINVYNPPGPRDQVRIEKWPDLAPLLRELHPRTIIIGDFNAHHPEWAGPTVAAEPKAQHLLQQMHNKGFTTLNKAGVTTWKRGEREAVLDLGFATRDLRDKVIAY